MENDIVIEENGPLHSYLRDLGYVEMETVQQRVPLTPFKSNERLKEQIDSGILDQVLTLRATNLLFEDDLSHVDTIFKNFESTKSDSLKYIFRGKSYSIILLFGLFLYFGIGSFALIIYSSFYAYRAADFMWKKHERLKLLKRLMSTVQSNYSLLTRIIKFLHEHEQMFKLDLKLSATNNANEVVFHLKKDFSLILSEVNAVFAEGTNRLLEKVPLCDYLENPESYSCRRMASYDVNQSISQLHNLYMLLQSQFLTRLIFSTVPNLMSKEQDPYITVGKIVIYMSSRLQAIHTNLNKKFKLTLLNGLYVDKSTSARSLPPKPPKHSDEYFCKGIHDLSNSLQFCLIKLRQLEEDIEAEQNVDFEGSLDLVKHEMASCQSLISDLEILHKRYNKTNSEYSPKRESIANDETVDEIPVRDLGFSDLDPIVDDDIFEMTVDDLTTNVEDLGDDAYFERDPLFKKKQRQLLLELKGRLKGQAEEWAKREALVMARKNMAVPESTFVNAMENNCDLDDDYEDNSDVMCRKFCNKYNRIYETECAEDNSDNFAEGRLNGNVPRNVDNCFFEGGSSLFAEALRNSASARNIMSEEFGDNGSSHSDET